MYFVMPRLGMNLHDLITVRNASFTEESIYTLGIQLINILEKVHLAGFIFNDLKLDNILLDFGADVSATIFPRDVTSFAKFVTSSIPNDRRRVHPGASFSGM